MATIPLKDITFPGLDNTYTIPEIDNTLSTAGKAADAKKTGDEIDQLKSEITDKSDTADMLKAFPTDTASGSVASFADGANVPVKSLIVNIDPVQSGSGDPSPTNVRPISGWSEVNVETSGKNLFEYDATKATTGTTTSGTTRAYYPLGFTNCTLTFSAELVDSSIVTNTYINIGKLANGRLTIMEGFITNTNITTKTVTFSENEQAVFITADTSAMSIINNFPKYKICVAIGSTATPYEPYHGESITIDLGQTVYGGTLDVLSGVITLEWYKGTFPKNGSMATIDGNPCYRFVNTDLKQSGNVANYICSHFGKANPTHGNPQNGQIANQYYNYYNMVVRNDSLSTLTEWWDWIDAQANNGTPVEICYKLIDPITVQLTPHEVTTLLGSNNVWADSGDSEVTYRADPTLYINKKIAEAISALS